MLLTLLIATYSTWRKYCQKKYPTNIASKMLQKVNFRSKRCEATEGHNRLANVITTHTKDNKQLIPHLCVHVTTWVATIKVVRNLRKR